MYQRVPILLMGYPPYPVRGYRCCATPPVGTAGRVWRGWGVLMRLFHREVRVVWQHLTKWWERGAGKVYNNVARVSLPQTVEQHP